MSELRAVFFDLDDTLCDTTGSRLPRARRAVSRLCADHPHLDAAALIARALEQPPGERWVRGVPRVVEELGLAATDAGRDAIDLWFFIGCGELVRPVSGAAAVVEALSREYTLGVITNGLERIQRGKVENLPFLRDVPHLVISECAGFEKPDPRIFALALAMAGVEPREAAFVGDRLDADIAGAASAGMRSVWMNWRGAAGDGSVRPDAIIRTLGELPAALRELGGR